MLEFTPYQLFVNLMLARTNTPYMRKVLFQTDQESKVEGGMSYTRAFNYFSGWKKYCKDNKLLEPHPAEQTAQLSTIFIRYFGTFPCDPDKV